MVFELLHEKIQEVLKKKGFVTPTLPQKLAIPEILKGENVLVIGPTGFGKTEAALLPIFSKMLEIKPKPIALLYITPLKSLNRDMLSRMLFWAKELGFGVSVRHGDTTAHERKLQVEHPDEMFIITPEQLQAMLTGKRIRKLLENVLFVVVDELHELVESKRGVQLAVALERLKKLCKRKFQIIALSATVAEPAKAASFIGCEKVIEAYSTKEYEIKVMKVKPDSEDRLLSEKICLDAEHVAKLRFIKEIAEKYRSVLIFTNTRETAEVLSSRLRALYPGFSQEVHHSSLSKHVRERAEKEFREGCLKAMIATSSLELGIDIGVIDCVIQYLSPRQVVKFLQRIGRSRHRIGEKAHGFILAGEGDDLFESCVIAKLALAHEMEKLKAYEKAYDVLAHQILGMLIEGYENVRDIYQIVKNAYPYRNLSFEEFVSVIELMKEIKLLGEERKLRKKRKGLLYYFENLTTIPEVYQYKVIDAATNTPVGKLDESWVAEHAEVGATFIVKGTPWRIISVEDGKVFAEEIACIDSAIPSWEGELIPVSYEVAREVGKLRRKINEWLKKGKEYAVSMLKENYPVSEEAAKMMVSVIRNHVKKHALPDDRTIVIEAFSDFVIIHCCFGTKVNETLGKFIAAMLSAEYGESILVKTDPYRIVIQGARIEDVKKHFLAVSSSSLEPVLKLYLPRTNLFKYRFMHVAKRFGIIRKDSRLDRINVLKLMEIFKNTIVEEEVFREIFLEKLDIKKAEEIAERIKKGEIEIKEISGPSVLGREGIKEFEGDVIKPEKIESEIFKAFKKRLLETKVRLVCVNCGKFSRVSTVKDIEDFPFCRQCGSRLLGMVSKGDSEALKILKKHLAGKELSKGELRKLERIKRTADLIIVHGKKAVIALAARGIGAKTASRILAKMHANEEEFLKDIYKAEREFIRTRKYWKP